MIEQREPRTIKVATLFIIFLMVIALVGGGVILRWAYQPSMALVVSNNPVPAKPDEVRDGEKIFLDINYCKLASVKIDSTVYLVGKQGAKIAIAWPVDGSEKGCNELTGVPVPVPAQTPTDTYNVEFTSCYDVNPIKKDKCTVFSSQDFKVVNSKLNPGDAKVGM